MLYDDFSQTERIAGTEIHHINLTHNMLYDDFSQTERTAGAEIHHINLTHHLKFVL